MRTIAAAVFGSVLLFSGQTMADERKQLESQLFAELRAACKKVKNYPEWRREVVGNYGKMLPKLIDRYLPGGKENATYLFVNPKGWADLSPKDAIAVTNAAYMVEVCAPNTSKLPILVVADWKTLKSVDRRVGFEMKGPLGFGM
jgi:hypothetical protein